MKKAITKFLITLAIFVALGVLQKILFLLKYHSIMGDAGMADWLSVIWHGLPMDCSVAGYLTAIPALLILSMSWFGGKALTVTEKTYFVFIAALLSIITCLDLDLYEYWGFRLDMTPVFYFTTSPASALASVTFHQILLSVIGIGVIAYGIYKAFALTVLKIRIEPGKHRIRSIVVMALFTAALIIPIRGGFTVATMNLSRSYFSDNQRLNHAAVNPAFSLLYSATHQNKFNDEYRFMPTDEARLAMHKLTSPASTTLQIDSLTATHNGTAVGPLFNCKRPDIYIIILESFSAHLMPSLGGESIAVNLDSLAREGVSFTNFYANSFRTDRALPSILSGFPAQPSMSLLKYVDKIEHLPSLAGELKKNGYDASYYYGGDINFANINAYLISSGFGKIIRDTDFPISERTGKWGAHDHLVFQRALRDTADASTGTPQLKVIQTSSSHEPFDVPYQNARFDGEPKKNAFAYTDSCLMDFVDALRQTSRWDRTLVVMVPDHLGAWPLNLDDPAERHRVPLVMTGGTLRHRNLAIDTPASQIDLVATLLGQLGIEASAFPFSKNILDSRTAHFAVFTEPSLIGILTQSDTVVFNCDANVTEKLAGPDKEQLENQTKAYLQTIYEHISDL